MQAIAEEPMMFQLMKCAFEVCTGHERQTDE